MFRLNTVIYYLRNIKYYGIYLKLVMYLRSSLVSIPVLRGECSVSSFYKPLKIIPFINRLYTYICNPYNFYRLSFLLVRAHQGIHQAPSRHYKRLEFKNATSLPLRYRYSDVDINDHLIGDRWSTPCGVSMPSILLVLTHL